MTILANQIKEISEEIFNDLVAIRRHLHQNPELSFKEYNTANFVEQKLHEIGIETFRLATTGVVGIIKGNNPESKTIALRADLDALPIYEENDVSYKSHNEGIMHACGHDVHTTSLLGASIILYRLRSKFNGTIKLIFQPGEEKIPGGASLLINEGVLQNPKVESIVAQHVFPFLPAGKVAFKKGMYMASADEIYLTVIGKGGHAALPEKNIDPIIISAHILTQLQTIVSRFLPPKLPAVLSFGNIHGHGATNVIPDKVTIDGTFRIMDEDWRYKAHEKIASTAKQIAQSFGGDCEVDIKVGYPYLKNDVELTEQFIGYAEEYLGKENVEDLDIWMGSEDFAFYTHHTKGCFYRLGTKTEGKSITPVHTTTFDIDENALKIGAGLMAYSAIRQLT